MNAIYDASINRSDKHYCLFSVNTVGFLKMVYYLSVSYMIKLPLVNINLVVIIRFDCSKLFHKVRLAMDELT